MLGKKKRKVQGQVGFLTSRERLISTWSQGGGRGQMGGYFQLCIAVTVALSSSYAPFFVVVDESGGPSRGRF